MNEKELQDIEKREQAATPGPWTMKQDGADFYMADSEGQYLDITLADAIFASHARQDIPALIAEVRRSQNEYRLFRYDAEAEITRLRALEDLVDDEILPFCARLGMLHDNGDALELYQKIKALKGGAE